MMLLKCSSYNSQCHADFEYGEAQWHVELYNSVAVALTRSVPQFGEAAMNPSLRL